MNSFARVLSLAAVLTTSLLQAAPHPFSVDDLVRLRRVSEPALSPDSETVVFTVRETDMDANRGRTDLWALDLVTKGALPRRITSHPENDGSAQWSHDGKWLYFLSGRSGSDQVWRMDLAGGEAQAVTQFPLDVGSFRLSPDGTKLIVSMEGYPDCADLACTAERTKQHEADKAKGVVHDRLFVRHWDTWKDGRSSRLYLVDLGAMEAPPIAIAPELDADVPSKPFGDRADYTFSPDNERIVFSARVKGRTEAWSTNFDLFEVTLSDPAKVTNLTESNPAWDAQPIFSPDGRMLAWRAMARPGFEADRFRIVVRDLKNGEQRVLTENWDRSADGIAFSADGKTIYADTDHFGQHPLWSIEVKSGKPTMLTGPGHIEAYSVGEREIVYSVSALRSPAELAAVSTRGELRDLPKLNTDLLQDVKLGDVEQFTFAGWNGETVYGHVVKPVDFKAGSKYPLAFIVHGGPQVSFGNQWSYRWNPQTYAGAGYAAVFIDFHGSPGYGQAFTDSISGDWGGKPLEDLQKGLDAALNKYQWLDGDRACALGASYGGYMM
ncbi:MAG: S9 family peptidase, partial [Steroidobacteraceae bacterium]